MTTTSFALDGVSIDLTRDQIDVYGCRWSWTGQRTPAGVPLMQSNGDTPLPLDEVYSTYGPLIPAPAPLTSAAVRAVLLADTPQPDRLPLPVRTPATPAASPAEEPKPAEPAPVPTPSTFARLLRRLRGGTRV